MKHNHNPNPKSFVVGADIGLGASTWTIRPSWSNSVVKTVKVVYVHRYLNVYVYFNVCSQVHVWNQVYS